MFALPFQPRREWFAGVDSDGCVFDSVAVKQRLFFHDETIHRWGLEKVGEEVRVISEEVNLRSRWRGANRFTALCRIMERLHEDPAVRRAGVALPDPAPLCRFLASGLPLDNAALRDYLAGQPDPTLQAVYDWSTAINARIGAWTEVLPPFPGARETLARMSRHADLLVVTQTPGDQVRRDWRASGLEPLVLGIAGPDLGTKARQLAWAAGRYPASHVLMVGDAPGDREAAAAVGALFFPILPGRETESWRELDHAGLTRWLNGTFDADYQARLVRDFEGALAAPG